jgi:PAT family beta-lactamase induction signal transducer AmpG
MSRADRKKWPGSNSWEIWLKPQVFAMLFLGLSAGVPILLIFSTLSVWLREAGVDRAAVTFFSWAALGYSFKFLWAPLIDLLPLPWLTRRLGRRRSWLLLSQFFIIGAICWMGSVDPSTSGPGLVFMALAAVLLGFSSATQDIIIDAYRIECADKQMQALLASMYIAGYRVGMLIAGAGSLFIAGWLGTKSGQYEYEAWQYTYYIMAGVMGCGVLTTLLVSEPHHHAENKRFHYSSAQYVRFLILFAAVVSSFALTFFASGPIMQQVYHLLQADVAASGKLSGFLHELFRFSMAVAVAAAAAYCFVLLGFVDRAMVNNTYLAPVGDFFKRYGLRTSLLFLALIGFYRLSDIVLGVVSNVFYVDMGFSKNVIAGITKSFGLLMTLLGGFLGGVLTVRFGMIRILFLGGMLSALTNLMFMGLARHPGNVELLTFVIGADNLSAGIATTAFVAFLSSLTNVSFTAVQYAIFSSLMTLMPKLVGGYSGTMVSALGYEQFFLLTTVIGLPVLLFVELVRRETENGRNDSQIRRQM